MNKKRPVLFNALAFSVAILKSAGFRLFLFLNLCCRRLGFVVSSGLRAFPHGVLEMADAIAQSLAQIAQFGRPEKQQCNHQDHHQVHWLHKSFKHFSSSGQSVSGLSRRRFF
jgi:hypothetical protein